MGDTRELGSRSWNDQEMSNTCSRNHWKPLEMLFDGFLFPTEIWNTFHVIFAVASGGFFSRKWPCWFPEIENSKTDHRDNDKDMHRKMIVICLIHSSSTSVSNSMMKRQNIGRSVPSVDYPWIIQRCQWISMGDPSWIFYGYSTDIDNCFILFARVARHVVRPTPSLPLACRMSCGRWKRKFLYQLLN